MPLDKLNPNWSGLNNLSLNPVALMAFDTGIGPSGAWAPQKSIEPVVANPVAVDAGGRSRVSQLTTLLDLKTLYADDPNLIERIVSGGTGLFSNNKYAMSVTSNGQYVISKSRVWAHYFSGKSQLIEITFDNFQPQTGVVKRVGYFNGGTIAPYQGNLDGFFLESSNGVITLKVYNNNTLTYSSVVSIDGYNWQNFTVVLFDFLWLGGAEFRLFLKTSAGFASTHDFTWAGTAQGTFFNSPNQPIRYDIYSTGGAGSFTSICSQVSTEGSINECGKFGTAAASTTSFSAANIGTKYLAKAIRGNTIGRLIKLNSFYHFVSSTNDIALLTLDLNPTITGGTPTWTTISGAPVQHADGNGSLLITGGTPLFSAIVTQNTVIIPQFTDDYLTYIGYNIAGVSDILSLSITPITATISCYAGMNFKVY